MSSDRLRDDLLRHLMYSLGTDPGHAQVHDWRMALSYAVRDRMIESWFASTRATYAQDHKRVYYLSMEYLIGRLLQDTLVNLGLDADARAIFDDLGINFDALRGDEPDAALGNGGLGRLAACFMESLATLGVPAYGYGIRYEHGLFRQRIENGQQIEEPEDWLNGRNPWEFERPEVAYRVQFGGGVDFDANGRAQWTPDEAILAQAYDTPVVGWKGGWANTLRLWSARPVRVLDLSRFNQGDHVGATADEGYARAISRVLYPDDTTEGGQTLRLKQEVFFTVASLKDILRRFGNTHDDLRRLPEKVTIQLNDTHPAIAGPELVRILHDERGLPFDEAEEIARGCLNYTNHTLLPEALESWPEGLMWHLLPRHMQIIERIDDKHAKANPKRRATIRGDGQVHMGDLSFIMANRVNGVSALHTDLMKSTVFSDLHGLHPDRIVNQTNGVTPRRWLLTCNPRLSGLITEAIGPGWIGQLDELRRLESLADDTGFKDRFAAAKHDNKVALAGWLGRHLDVTIDPSAIFDVQIKRIHEYKRQHMNVLEAIALWQELRDNPGAGGVPRVKIFAGKAAPGYYFAKDIVRLINDVAKVINTDPVTRDRLQVVFVPNYNVSLAERLIPASDLSEQISTAGKEASGTGNMKFAMNGALTIGTLDGANVEIREQVGAENFYLFGLKADEVPGRRADPDHAAKAVAASPRLARALDEIARGTFSPGEPDRHKGIAHNIETTDYFLVASDFEDYWRAQRAVDDGFADPASWVKSVILNTARSGWFSSDRTIRGYLADVWRTGPLQSGSPRAAE